MYSALQHKPFTLFWYARISTAVAFQMLGVAVGWQVYSLTNSALYLGLVGLAQFLPMLLLILCLSAHQISLANFSPVLPQRCSVLYLLSSSEESERSLS